MFKINFWKYCHLHTVYYTFSAVVISLKNIGKDTSKISNCFSEIEILKDKLQGSSGRFIAALRMLFCAIELGGIVVVFIHSRLNKPEPQLPQLPLARQPHPLCTGTGGHAMI